MWLNSVQGRSQWSWIHVHHTRHKISISFIVFSKLLSVTVWKGLKNEFSNALSYGISLKSQLSFFYIRFWWLNTLIVLPFKICPVMLSKTWRKIHFLLKHTLQDFQITLFLLLFSSQNTLLHLHEMQYINIALSPTWMIYHWVLWGSCRSCLKWSEHLAAHCGSLALNKIKMILFYLFICSN